MTRTLFLPGAGASAEFWRPVAELTGLDAVMFAWPGLGQLAVQSIAARDFPIVQGIVLLGAFVSISRSSPVSPSARRRGLSVPCAGAISRRVP